MSSINAATTPLSNRAQIEQAANQLFEAARALRLPCSEQRLSAFNENFQLIRNAYANLLSNPTTPKIDRLLITAERIGHLNREMELLSVCNAACSAPPSEKGHGLRSLQSEAIIAVDKRIRENGLSIRDLPANVCPSTVLKHAPKGLHYEIDIRALMNSPIVREEQRVPDWIETLQLGLQIHYGFPARAFWRGEKAQLSRPLHLAFNRREHGLLEILLKAGADPNDGIRLDRPWTPLLTFARSRGDTRSIELLLQYGATEAYHAHGLV